jgi:hypothetical protein
MPPGPGAAASRAVDRGDAVNLPLGLKHAIRAVANVHRQGAQPNIFLFATARGGSTWLMEILASQPGMKYYDEPLNLRRPNVASVGLFKDWDALMPGTGDAAKVIGFLQALARGRHGALNPPPLRPYHRLFTDRIVFKLHELEHMMGDVARACHGVVLFLLRHPVPTSQSRKEFPRLHLYPGSPYFDALLPDPARRREIAALAGSGTHLQRGVVAWCYQNLVPLTKPDFDGLVVTYEELVLNPVKGRDLLCDRFQFPDRDGMLRAFERPSSNIAMSNTQTLQMMTDADARARRVKLVTKWKGTITPDEERQVSHIMDLFGLDVYNGTSPLAADRYLHFADTPALLAGEPAARSITWPDSVVR